MNPQTTDTDVDRPRRGRIDTCPGLGHVGVLILAAIGENFGYRRLTLIPRVQGSWRWLRRSDASWGAMARKALWQSPGTTPIPATVTSTETAAVTPTGMDS